MPGQFLFSMDFELGWGSIENGRWREREERGVYRRLRADLADLLRLLDHLELPFTWATVGAMIDDPAQLSIDHLPNWYRNKVRKFISESDVDTRDGRDLLDEIRSMRAEHEIACHSYSHIRMQAQGVGEATVIGEMEQFNRVARSINCAAVCTLVFPANEEGWHSLYRDRGIRIYRASPQYIRKVGGLANQIIAKGILPPPMSETTEMDKNLLRNTGTLFFNWSGSGRFIRRLLTASQAARALRQAVKSKQVIHLWMHPFNLSEVPGLKSGFFRFLHSVARHRDAGELVVSRMRDLCD